MNKFYFLLFLPFLAGLTVKAQEYRPEDYPTIIPDKKIAVSSAYASNSQWGEDASKSIDGNLKTLYHSSWINTVFPVTIDYHLKNAALLDYLIYSPRTSGMNGNFKEIEVWVSTASRPKFVKTGAYNLEGKGTPSIIHFPGGLKSPKTVRIIVKSGVGDNSTGFASCAEMSFYEKKKRTAIPAVFTDGSCSKLRPGVRKQDIDAIGNNFFRHIATGLFNKTYPEKFRIQEYKPYPNPETVAQENKTSTYSLLDNPVGICVTENDEELIVLVGETGNESISLLLIDYKKGYSPVDFLLFEGINRLKTGTKETYLLYIMYHTSNPAAKPVKIHFATGTVNGYYDIAKHTPAEGKRLLDNAKGNDFDIVGKYAHVTFPTASLKQYCPDLNRLIQVYDSLVWLQQQFIGLYKYNRANANRMFFHVDYNMPVAWGAYATAYRTAYPLHSMNTLCNAEILRSSAVWGPAHEVGHVNQTRPGFRWGGMGEVSNNVYALYVQAAFGNRSRLADEGDAGYGSRYEKGFTEILAAKALHSTYGDVFCKLIPFWQLELYCARVKGKTGFYADVHEQIRLLPDPVIDSDAILQFVKICCDAAKEDLTDFFQAWGLLTPVNYRGKYAGYGSGDLTLAATPKQIEEVVRYAGQYPKPAVKVQYIHDGCIEAYRNCAKIEAGDVEINGNRVLLNGWKQVAVFEIYDDNKLAFITPNTKFRIPASIKNPEIYAVSAQGEKTKAN